jgi:endonuclease/exonuclease/phosphatase (EEP) superfamily protein YafD
MTSSISTLVDFWNTKKIMMMMMMLMMMMMILCPNVLAARSNLLGANNHQNIKRYDVAGRYELNV